MHEYLIILLPGGESWELNESRAGFFFSKAKAGSHLALRISPCPHVRAADCHVPSTQPAPLA